MEKTMNDGESVPLIRVEPPGPIAQKLLARDDQYLSPSYTRAYPLVAASGSAATIEDVDGNRYLDFTAGIAVVAIRAWWKRSTSNRLA
jgi:4-aminobutyrate aminotransferase